MLRSVHRKPRQSLIKRVFDEYFSKMVIAYVIVSINIFTYKCLDIFVQVHDEPKVVIGCYFGFMTGEVWALAIVTKHKRKKEITNEGTVTDEPC